MTTEAKIKYISATPKPLVKSARIRIGINYLNERCLQLLTTEFPVIDALPPYVFVEDWKRTTVLMLAEFQAN